MGFYSKRCDTFLRCNKYNDSYISCHIHEHAWRRYVNVRQRADITPRASRSGLVGAAPTVYDIRIAQQKAGAEIARLPTKVSTAVR
jgi:hypothetical protein